MSKTDKKIIFLNEVDSTNNYAKQLILTNAVEEGTVVLAQYQKTGKGQQGNSWESENGMNFLASIIIRPTRLPASRQFQISKIVSLAILRFLQKEVNGVSIKWPNDIYVGNKKIAGILIENTIKGQNLDSSIIGIGLNLNQLEFFSNAPNPVSLKNLTGNEFTKEVVLNEIMKNFWKWYKKLEYENYEEIDSAYFSNLFRNNGWHLFKKDDKIFETRIAGIGEFGQLLLEDKKGEISEFMFKEVEFVIDI